MRVHENYDLYLEEYEETKQGGAPGRAGGGKVAKKDKMSPFAKDAAELTCKTPRTINRHIKAHTCARAVAAFRD